mgnify:FL=1
MPTISVPINAKQEEFINDLVKSGIVANKAHAVRRAIDLFAEEEAVRAVLRAQKEPNIKGDLRKLVKKF